MKRLKAIAIRVGKALWLLFTYLWAIGTAALLATSVLALVWGMATNGTYKPL